MINKPLWSTIVDALAWLLVVVWTCYASLGTNVFGSREWPSTMVDYHLLYDFARKTVEQRSYPAHYPYPPSAVVLQYAAAQLPFAVSAALYLALITVAAVACWYVLARLVGLNRRPGSAILLLPALAASSSYLMWDLRSANCNVLFLLTVLLAVYAVLRGRAAQAGFWLALSVALKLFSILLIPYLLWRGERRAFAWTLAFSLVFWIVLPTIVFGPHGTRDVYAGWLGALDVIGRHAVDPNHPILISLAKSVAWISGDNGAIHTLVMGAVWGLWLMVAALGAMASDRCGDAQDAAHRWLADAGLLILAPIALSPYLEPYHPVALAIPALLLLHMAADPHQPRHVRRITLLLFIATLAAGLAPVPWELRGLRTNLQLLIATLGGVIVVWQGRAVASVRQSQQFPETTADRVSDRSTAHSR